MSYRTQVKIDLDAIEYNFNQTKAKLPNNTKLLAVIKADAYGHGAVAIGKFLDKKCDMFGVACIEEALELKNAGITTPILILGYVAPDDYKAVVENEIRIPVFSLDMAQALSSQAVSQNTKAYYHFCIDTGMSRIGYQVNEQSAKECKEIAQLPNIEAEGIFSHYATADESDLTKANQQKELFLQFVNMLSDLGVNPPIKHISNSAGIMNFDECFDMCRLGIALYGMYPSEDVDKSLLDLKPALCWASRVSHIKTLPPGREISYGGTYKTNSHQTIATIPMGYADGYPRCLSNKGKVIVNGKIANIVGRVCMDQFMIDVTDIEGVQVGSEVVLVGSQGDSNISMEEVANAAHSFNYEQACRINRRVPRIYYKNGKIISETMYLL